MCIRFHSLDSCICRSVQKMLKKCTFPPYLSLLVTFQRFFHQLDILAHSLKHFTCMIYRSPRLIKTACFPQKENHILPKFFHDITRMYSTVTQLWIDSFQLVHQLKPVTVERQISVIHNERQLHQPHSLKLKLLRFLNISEWILFTVYEKIFFTRL